MNEPKWIPVSERLPEDGAKVLVTYKRWHDGSRFVDMGTFTDCDGEPMWWTEFTGNGDEIIAWMPMIEPYRAERRTDE